MSINYYNPYVREELMLYHHGILGQRWGKKNGPPYPIAPSAHSASEKKAGWRKSLAGKISDHRRQKADRDAANDVAFQTGTNALNFSKHVTKQNSGYGTMRRYGQGVLKTKVSKEYADQYNESRKKYLDAVSKLELKDPKLLEEAKKKNPDFIVKGEKNKSGDSDLEKLKREYGSYANVAEEYNKAKSRGETGSGLDNKIKNIEKIKNSDSNVFSKKYQKEYERLKSLEDKGFLNEMSKDHSTDHPFSNKNIKEELKYLSEVVDRNSPESDSSSDIDRYVAFQKKIVDKSINWHDDIPISERAKQWKKNRIAAEENIENTLGKKYRDIDKKVQTARNKVFDKYEGTDINDKKLYEAFKKELDSIKEDPKYKSVYSKYNTARNAVRASYDSKLVDIVLKDLGIPVTDENRYLIINSKVLFWD